MGKTNKHFEREGFSGDRRSERHRVNNILSHFDIDKWEDRELDYVYTDHYDNVKNVEKINNKENHKKKNKWEEE